MDRLADLRAAAAAAAAATSQPSDNNNNNNNNNNDTTQRNAANVDGRSDDGGGDDDGAQARRMHKALQRARSALDAFVRAIDEGEVVQPASSDVEAALQSRHDDVQAALAACERSVRAYEARTTALRNSNTSVNETRLRMYDNVAAHANDELQALRQRAWDAQDHRQQLRVARVARQLRLRLATATATTAPLHPALARHDGKTTARPLRDAAHDERSSYSSRDDGGGGGGDVDVQLLAESLVHGQRDGDVFAMTPYEMQQAVERYRVFCDIEEKAKLLHRLSTQLNALVHDKGEQVDAAVQRTEALRTRAYAGTAQLQRAKHYHSYCGCCCTVM